MMMRYGTMLANDRPTPQFMQPVETAPRLILNKGKYDFVTRGNKGVCIGRIERCCDLIKDTFPHARATKTTKGRMLREI